MAERDPGQSFALDIAHRIALDLREIAHLGLGKTYVLDNLLVERLVTGLDIGALKTEARRRPAIELPRILRYRGIAARFDAGQDVLHDGAHARVLILRLLPGYSLFQDRGRHGAVLPWLRIRLRIKLAE